MVLKLQVFDPKACTSDVVCVIIMRDLRVLDCTSSISWQNPNMKHTLTGDAWTTWTGVAQDIAEQLSHICKHSLDKSV